MLPITGWELVYANGSTVTSEQSTWAKAPAAGVQMLVMLHDPPYATVTYGEDFYLLPGQPARTRKAGQWMDDRPFHELVGSVMDRLQKRT